MKFVQPHARAAREPVVETRHTQGAARPRAAFRSRVTGPFRAAGVVAATLGVILVSAHAATAQTQLPDGAGKEETARVCGTCHPPERAASVRLTRDGWQETITKMVGLGAKGTDKELEAVLDYLSTNFKGEAARPLNLNTATAVDLESIVSLLRRESAAWIDYRTKSGPCKTLDDLKKVKGLDFKKIEDRKDRLVCF